MERGILAGLAAYRWAAWAWMAAVLVISRDALSRPPLAYALVGVAFVVTVGATVLLRTRPLALLQPAQVSIEVLASSAVVLGDGWTFGAGHAFSVSQSLGITWPLAAVLSSGVAGGTWLGAGTGALLGACRVLAVWGNGVRDFGGDRVLSLLTTAVLYVTAGAVAGHVTRLLRRAERELSFARAREEVARTLHDGVLQTLAVIEHRADDPALARMAREQERQLRDYVAGRSETGDAKPDLASALRAAGARFEDAFGGLAQIVVADDLPDVRADRIGAITGAAREALTNAGKHGSAGKVTVFVEPVATGVFCSVKDDGVGFDPERTTEGLGITNSIRERLTEVGGRVEIESRVGGPTEVRMWVP
jgi:signal transduction histidine kinase